MRGKYHFTKSPQFFVSRFFRLYPAFAFIAIVEICLYYFGSSYMGYGAHPDRITWARTLANFTFTADFFSIQWYIPVFWTLAVELQFYLLLLIVFPLINSSKKWIPSLTILLLATGPLLLGKGDTILTYTPLFACGMSAFLYYSKRINLVHMLALITICTLIHSTQISQLAALTSAFTAIAIVFIPHTKSKIITFLSNISYSFFLIHITVGGAILFNFYHLPNQWQFKLPVVILATILSAIVASLFHLYIEKPLHQFSRSFKKPSN